MLLFTPAGRSGTCGGGRLLPGGMETRTGSISATALSDDEVDRLAAAITACIADGLAHERTLDKMSKSADRPGAVHRRKGATCPVCGDTVRAVEYNAYEVDYCPTCRGAWLDCGEVRGGGQRSDPGATVGRLLDRAACTSRVHENPRRRCARICAGAGARP